jgi:hypothetical protein
VLFLRACPSSTLQVASDVVAGKIEYYDEEAVHRKWSDEGTADQRFRISKFKAGGCYDVPSGAISPCDAVHRPPKVQSELMPHAVQHGEAVM